MRIVFVLVFLLSAVASLRGGELRRSDKASTAIKKLISSEGKSPPPWWDDVQLNYPKTLDMSWPKKPKGGWNNKKNMGQYIWDIINPNPNKWQGGVKLLHQVMKVNKSDKDLQKRAMGALATMYHNLLQDYARAAYWQERAGAKRVGEALRLANCYHQLGNTALGERLLKRIPEDRTRRGEVIKAWASFGNLKQALKLADKKIKKKDSPDAACLAAGDACRLHGDFDKALAYYEHAVALKKGGRDFKQNIKIARASLKAIKVFDRLDLTQVRDGAFRSSSMGYNADMEVEVKVQGGKIINCRVTRHQEKQFYSAIEDTTRQIVEKQSVADVDGTTGATITSKAIIHATAQALSENMR